MKKWVKLHILLSVKDYIYVNFNSHNQLDLNKQN